MKKMPQKVPKESHECIKFFQEMVKRGVTGLFHIRNESRSIAESMIGKKMGVVKGVPDYFLCQPSDCFHGLFIEMKRKKGGKLSQEQKDWIELVKSKGYEAVVCYGAEEAIDIVDNYVKWSK
jgi:hypothetical protein